MGRANINATRERKQKAIGRLNLVAEYYLKGWTMIRIAQELHEKHGYDPPPSKSTIKTDIDKLLKEWKEDRLNNIEEHINVELQTIDYATRELWGEWERSKKAFNDSQKVEKFAIINTPVETVNSSGELEIVSVPKEILTEIDRKKTKKKQFGDPRYIAEIAKLAQERRKLLGLYPKGENDEDLNLNIIINEVVSE